MSSRANTQANNHFSKVLSVLDKFPAPVKNQLVGFAFGRYTRYFRTNKLRVKGIDSNQVTLTLANHALVRNHIGGIHAVAVTLACEYASGLLVGQHVPDSSIVVVKSIHVDLHKPIQGAVQATATITDDQIQAIRFDAKGNIEIHVTEVDEASATPITGTMTMAWFPKKAKSSK